MKNSMKDRKHKTPVPPVCQETRVAQRAVPWRLHIGAWIATAIAMPVAIGLAVAWAGGVRGEAASPGGGGAAPVIIGDGVKGPRNMAWIPGGTFMMGSDHKLAQSNERPAHKTRVHGLWMDQHHVTNAEFQAFVSETGYVTTAERKPDWETIRVQVPPGTPRPSDTSGAWRHGVRWHRPPRAFAGLFPLVALRAGRRLASSERPGQLH